MNRTIQRAVIRACDLLLALALTPFVLLFLWVVTGVYVLAHNGQVLFRQERVGKNGVRFTCWKIRTWDRDGDAPLEHWFTKKLVSWGLDETPQIIFNVLPGTMSFIGPRGLTPEDAEGEPAARFEVLPGVSGAYVLGLYNDVEFVRYRYGVWTWLQLCAYTPYAIATGRKQKHTARRTDECQLVTSVASTSTLIPARVPVRAQQ